MGSGTARGGRNDHICAEKGRDLVVGDSYSPRGRAVGRDGDDALNGDHRADTIVGDSYTKTGVAIGNGDDRVHGLWGNDSLFGDSLAASRSGKVRGGGRDVLNGASGNDHLRGGRRRDICAGGSGRNRARACEHRLQIP